MYKKYLIDPKNATHIRVGVGIILHTDKKILLEKRADCQKWGLIGGGVEVGEELKMTALRECQEETSLKLNKNNLQFLGVYSDISQYRIIEYPDNCFHAIDIIYSYKIAKNIKLKKSIESLKLTFFPFDCLPEQLVPPAKNPIEDFIKLIK